MSISLSVDDKMVNYSDEEQMWYPGMLCFHQAPLQTFVLKVFNHVDLVRVNNNAEIRHDDKLTFHIAAPKMPRELPQWDSTKYRRWNCTV